MVGAELTANPTRAPLCERTNFIISESRVARRYYYFFYRDIYFLSRTGALEKFKERNNSSEKGLGSLKN